MKSGEISMKDYSITYVVDPKKAYVVQPKEGEIDYSMAEKNPVKFIDKVLSQDVLEHKIAKKTRTSVVKQNSSVGEMPMIKRKSRGMEITSRLTKRAVARIIIAVQNKLHSLLKDLVDAEHDPMDVREALNHPQTKDVVQRLINSQGIKLVEPNSNAVVYRQQMSLIGVKGDRATDVSPSRFQDGDDTVDPEDARLVS